MNSQEYYLSLPHDMSGSMSKNRFRIELLWGIGKMLDVYDIGNFTMVFDYACDIELHRNNTFDFFQIKSHVGSSSYTCKKLTEVKGEGSILGKLYVLNKDDPDIHVNISVVSNSFVRTGNSEHHELIYCFDSLPISDKELVINSLKKELSVSKVDLKNVFFIHTGMNLAEPKYEIIGKLVSRFLQINGREPLNPNALYRLIYDAVVDKACYEYSDTDYNTLIAHKGFTKKELDLMFNAHSFTAKTGLAQAEEYIEKLDDIRLKRSYKKSLTKVMNLMCSSHVLKQLEQTIGIFLLSNEDTLVSLDFGVELLISKFHDKFSIEYDNADKIIFYVIILNRFIEGGYDK